MKINVPDYILAIDPYIPGKPIQELEREYGIKNSIKLASNENPLGPSPLALQAIGQALGSLNRYPDGGGYYLVDKLSKKLGIPAKQLILGNGSDDIIGMLAKALLTVGDEAIMPFPSFLMYEIMVRSVGANPINVPLKDLAIDLSAILEKITPKTKLIFLTNPNNPTGTIFPESEFRAFLKKVPSGVVTVLDEAYIEFVRDSDCIDGMDLIKEGLPLVALRTFSKAYGLAGLRIGYGAMPSELVGLLNRIRQPFNVNSLAQVAAVAALDDHAFLEKTIRTVHSGLDFFYEALEHLGLTYYRSQANFMLIDVRQEASQLFEKMLKEGIIIRSMKSYRFPEYIRVNVGLESENKRFVETLEKLINM